MHSQRAKDMCILSALMFLNVLLLLYCWLSLFLSVPVEVWVSSRAQLQVVTTYWDRGADCWKSSGATAPPNSHSTTSRSTWSSLHRINTEAGWPLVWLYSFSTDKNTYFMNVWIFHIWILYVSVDACSESTNDVMRFSSCICFCN